MIIVKLKIGTRRSKLALVQTEMVISAIKAKFPDIDIETVYIVTKGDKILDKSLSVIGGKGVFIAEIEKALTSGEIDLAVHSAKDLPAELADGTVIGAVLHRGDARDVLVTRKNIPLKNNPVIGTGSQRRKTQFLKIYPDAVFADIRGNVDTRLDKLADGLYDGIILAAAGLKRLGFENDERFDIRYFSTDEFIPSACQGIIAVQSRANEYNDILSLTDDYETHICFDTERKILRLENSDCSSPMGAYSFIDNGRIHIITDRHRTGQGSADGKISEWSELAYKAWSMA